FQAVVDQTVAGLTQGRALKGKIVFLGGPLHFLYGLRERFVETLHLDGEHAVFPADGDCFAGIGAALCASDYAEHPFDELLRKLEESVDATSTVDTCPLFTDQADYDAFLARHNAKHPRGGCEHLFRRRMAGHRRRLHHHQGGLISPDGGLLYTYYHANRGNPVAIVLEQLKRSTACGETASSSVVGRHRLRRGPDQNAFLRPGPGGDGPLQRRRPLPPDVDFIIDIGGQDMKCLRIRDHAVDSISVNEACSSGCGSFVETFAKALGYNIADFSKMGLLARHPVNLGSRCTVFMNSSVKQAQKDGASVEDISAGLSISVVRNAIYKVIRAANADDLGQHIVVQGGTFLNDAVLRSFEREIGREVTRPTISGIMGAYGAALAAKEAGLERSALLSPEALATFTHEAKPATCKLCTNHCSLTINRFDGGRKFISGNRCSRPLGQEKVEIPDLMKFKYEYLRTLQGKGTGDGSRGRIGLPFGLNMYENLPFWYTLFTELNFEVVLSPESTRSLYIKGQQTIPSDTVCYPAKLLHGHVMALLEEGVDTIFYPCMSYNFDEHLSDNHYNCPVVAYYPDLLGVNIPALGQVNYLHPNLGLHRPKDFEKKGAQFLQEAFGIPKREAVKAIRKAYEAYDAFRDLVRRKGAEYIDWARANGHRILVVAGRPYHMDPEINHGINDLITGFGFVLVTEDAVFQHMDKQPRHVLNQWTYHARMYNAARYVCTQPDMAFLQLVSFGCGVDAITTDELRSILEEGGDLYTQIKIDDISNLGAVRIRIRSLMAALDARDAQAQKGGQ
ncbi:MAG: acyl-CoA dehydratase activase-related protein, partial [Evtepia sp.]